MDASQGVADELPDAADERRRRRTIALAVGFALLALAVVVTLSRDAKGRLGTNDVPAQDVVASAGSGQAVCQDRERIPSGTGAVRIALAGGRRVPPRIALTLTEGGAVRAAGGPGARWESGSTARVPLARPLTEDVTGSVCIGALGAGTHLRLKGATVGAFEGASVGGHRLPGRVRLEYLAAGGGSWWSSVSTIVRRMGLGHVWSGASVPLLVVLLTLTSIALGAWQLVRSDS